MKIKQKTSNVLCVLCFIIIPMAVIGMLSLIEERLYIRNFGMIDEYYHRVTAIIAIWNLVTVSGLIFIFMHKLDTKCIIRICLFVILIGMIFQFINIERKISIINNQTKETSVNQIKELYWLMPDVGNLVGYILVCMLIRDIYLKLLYSMAVHESGHAVIGSVLIPNLKMERIFIKSFCGAVSYTNREFNLEESIYFISVYYAGKIAVENILKQEDGSCEQDMEDALELSKKIMENFDEKSISLILKGEDDICKKTYNIAQELVDIHKQEILEVAKALMKKRTLYGEEVQKILMKN